MTRSNLVSGVFHVRTGCAVPPSEVAARLVKDHPDLDVHPRTLLNRRDMMFVLVMAFSLRDLNDFHRATLSDPAVEGAEFNIYYDVINREARWRENLSAQQIKKARLFKVR